MSVFSGIGLGRSTRPIVPRWGLLASAFVVLLPVVPLWPLTRNFYLDWYNHQWAVGYVGESLRQHWTVPSAFNAEQWVGLASPVFYATLGYPLLGVPAVVFAPGVVLRLCAISLFAAQFFLVRRAFTLLRIPAWFGRVMGALVVWAVYPLTTLYNRGAFTEFFATSLLTCAVGFSLLLYASTTRVQRRRHASLTLLCLTVAAGTHPITAVFGVPFFLVLSLFLWTNLRDTPVERSVILRDVVLFMIPGVVCLSAWLYATGTHAGDLYIRQTSGVWLDPAGLDNWLTRFSPMPFDGRVRPGVPLEAVSTPYLDAQMNVPLLIFVSAFASGVLVDAGRKRLGPLLAGLAVPTVLLAFFTWISLSQASYAYLPPIFSMIQFPYRAITYQNLAILLGAVALAIQAPAAAASVLRRRAVRFVALGCVALAAAGVVIKWSHVRATARRDGSGNLFASEDERAALRRLPLQYYGPRDYSTPRLFPPLPPSEALGIRPARFETGSGVTFGDVVPLELSLPAATWIGTNVQAFPWNRFYLDNRPLPRACLRVYQATDMAVLVPYGGQHELSVRFEPDPIWRILRALSLMTLFIWVGHGAWVLLGPAGERLRFRRRERARLAAEDRQVRQ